MVRRQNRCAAGYGRVEQAASRPIGFFRVPHEKPLRPGAIAHRAQVPACTAKVLNKNL